MNSRKDGAPHLPTVALSCGDWALWCIHCHRWHLHSAGAGHREAHCSSEIHSPYTETGYVLDEALPADKFVEADWQRAKPRGPRVVA